MVGTDAAGWVFPFRRSFSRLPATIGVLALLIHLKVGFRVLQTRAG